MCTLFLTILFLNGPPVEDAFVIELELIQSDSLENDMIVEGQYASETCMEEWGWSKPLS